MRKYLVFSALSLLVLGTGCSMDITMEHLSKNPIAALFSKTKMSGLTSGSTQVGTAAGGYVVQTTVGAYMSDMEQTTTDNSYKVYSSVQGGLIGH